MDTGLGVATPGRHRKGAPRPPVNRPPVRKLAGRKLAGRRPPARRLEVIGLLVGLSVGVSVALGWLAARGGTQAPGHAGGPAVMVTGTVGGRAAARADGPDPGALDAQWATYSDHSTCADWAGGDGVSAVPLGSSQIAWFFSDTYLGPAGPASGFSRSSGFLHNSVVIQTVTGRGSRFVTMTGGGACAAPGHPVGQPGSVVSPGQAPGAPDERYWDEDGITIGGTVVKFYNRYLPGGVPFVPTGTVIARFGARALGSAGRGPAYGAVARPQLFPLPSYVPPGGSSPITWGAALLPEGNTVYVYGTQTPGTPVPARQLYLARVPASRLTQFAAWQFYAGNGRWAGDQQDAQPVQPPGGGLSVSSGFSVVKVNGTGSRYWLIQADPLVGSNDIDAYPAAAPWGPFDPAAGIVLYRNPDVGLDAAHDYRIMYEARAEPALSTGHTLVISYNVNSLAVTTGCVPMSVFTNTVTLPRFITVPLSVLGGGGPGLTGTGVRAGTSDYPHVVRQDRSQWFDEWTYPGGCPPVPAVTGVQARPRPDAVVLSWPDAGLGLRYQVYLLAPGAAGYTLQATARSDSATLSGLRAGTYLARVVPVNQRQGTGPAAEVTFTVP